MRTCENLWDTRDIVRLYVVRPAPDLKPKNVGLRKRASFSAISTKHKASLVMLPCVSKQLPIAEETPLSNATPEWNDKEYTSQTRQSVQSIFDRKDLEKKQS